MPIALLDERDKAELQEQISNSANAIKNTVSGSAVALTDISPIEHILKVKARSENILPPLTTLKKDGVTISKENDYYVLNGTCTASAPVVVGNLALDGGTYTLSANNPQHASNKNALIQIYSASANISFATANNVINGVATSYLPQADDYQVRVRIVQDFVYDNFIIKPKLQKGEIATPYTPYVDISTASIVVNGETTYPINADGIVDGITSTDTTTTLIPDKSGIVLDVEYNKDINKAFGELNEEVCEVNAGINKCITADDVILRQGSVLTKQTIGVSSILENPNSYLNNSNNYSPTPTMDPIGMSNFRICRSGDVLKYKLSINKNFPILATYNKDFNVVNVVLGQGQSTYLEGEYTFAGDEVYFRVCGCSKESYLSKYYVNYKPVYSSDEFLPNYYTDYMAERITTINNKDCMVGSHGDSFVFITDTHTPRNKMRSPLLIKEIVNNTAVRFVINGGDTLDDEDTWSGAISQLREWRNLMRGITEYRIMGNHDLNKVGNTIEEAYLSTEDWYGTMVKPLEDTIQTDGKYYFCIDNESQKIRYICLSYLNNANAEKLWLKERLTELPVGWTTLVVSHYLFDDATGTIHANGQIVIDCINEVYSTMNATLIGILAGHNHADYSTIESVNGYHLIATTCDTFTGTPTKTVGTYTEQAFDVIHIDTTNKKMYATRIGAGNDREWSY